MKTENAADLAERRVVAMELTSIRGRNVLPAEQAAWYAGISRYTLLNLARDQQIPHYKKGKLIFFKTEDLDRWMMGGDNGRK